MECYSELCRVVERTHKTKRTITGDRNNLFSLLITAQDMITRQRIFKTAVDSKYIGPCYAGALSGVIFSNGDVGPCELLHQTFGNLRNHEFQINSIWNTRQAEDIREKIKKSKCYCTYECAMLCNILFNPRYLPSLLKKTAGLWLFENIMRKSA